MNDESSLVISGLTHYRFRETGSDEIHEMPVGELSTKQWRRFAQQAGDSRAEIFWQTYRRFMAELAQLQGCDGSDCPDIADQTLEMRRLKATLRVVRDAACQRMLRSWRKKHVQLDDESALRVVRHKAGQAAVQRLAILSTEQKEILGDEQHVSSVEALRAQVSWCNSRDVRRMERAFRKRIGNVFAFIEITPDQIAAFRAEAATQQPREPLQLTARAPSHKLDDFDVVAYLEDEDDDVMARMLSNGSPGSAQVRDSNRGQVGGQSRTRSDATTS